MDILGSFKDQYKNEFSIYKASYKEKNGSYFFLARNTENKYLVVITRDDFFKTIEFLKTEEILLNKEYYRLYFAPLNFNNMKLLMKIFKTPKISVCTKNASFGTGDRLGIVTPAHLEALNYSNIFPVLAQQSVRELTKTKRTWKDVISCAYWGCFEVGYEGFFGADADHVKDPENLKAACKAGFSMFTIDSSDFIKKNAGSVKNSEIEDFYNIKNKNYNFTNYYSNKKLKIGNISFEFETDMLKLLVYTYFEAIIHVKKCYNLLLENKSESFDLEVSMDEIPEPITPLAHIFIAQELSRQSIDFKNMALRFVGKWEKAVDYMGDLDEFNSQIKIHAEIVKSIGGYKLSLHSGSDKFSVYSRFSYVNNGRFHVKTSGVSWLEALRVIAKNDTELFKEIFNFCLKNFEAEKVFYDVSADLSKLKNIYDISDIDLVKLLDFPAARQVLHINYGALLDLKDKNGKNIFRDRIYSLLFKKEDEHYIFVSDQIGKHIKLLRT